MRSTKALLRETVNGFVAADGSISAGVGFTVIKIGTGSYTVRLFNKRPFVAIANSANNPIMTTCATYDRQSSSGSFNVTIQNGSGAAIDQAFNFVCECVPT